MEIRKATIADLEPLTQLCITTFIEAYGIHNTPENLNFYLQEAFNATQLTQELQSETEAYFILSEHDLPIAYIKLRYDCCPPDIADENWVEIQRIYVAGEHQQRGLGKELLKIAEAEAVSSGAHYIWLGVWQNNPKAIRFYEKNGFSIFGTQEFWLGDDCQSDFLMHKKVVYK